jgi:flavin-dependent dehydrogenase
MNFSADTNDTVYDVVICGAGLAGLTLARQITREVPEASLLLIEGTGDKSRTSAINVGESTVEISAHYLADILDLRAYLYASHFVKTGLRFFFGTGNDRFQDRPEFGLARPTPVHSFQINRKTLETDLKKFNAEAGIQMLPEGRVEDITLANGDGLHEITVLQDADPQRQIIKSRWVVDAMGRRRFLQKKLGLAASPNPRYSASWFRIDGRIDVDDLVPLSETEWHDRVPERKRYYSTNHLMGPGRWVWLIPLASGGTSIGIVTQEDCFPFTEYNTYERALSWLEKYEPSVRDLVGAREPIDFQCLRHYSYSAKHVFSSQRWACTGDAAVFADPFFSPGIDQVGYANTIITEMIKRDHEQRLQPEAVHMFNRTFLSFHTFTTWLIQNGYSCFGNALVTGPRLLWTLTLSFALSGPQRYNRIYLDEEKASALEHFVSRISLLTFRLDKLLKEWASRTQREHSYQFINYITAPGMKELYLCNLRGNKTLSELLTDHQSSLEYFEELAQIVFLIALADIMPEMIAQLPSPLWLNAWAMSLDVDRWQIDGLFSPVSEPRPLRLAEFFPLFGVADLLAPYQERERVAHD